MNPEAGRTIDPWLLPCSRRSFSRPGRVSAVPRARSAFRLPPADPLPNAGLQTASGGDRVVTHFETTQREVWLTIDDGPDPVDTPRLLEILRRFEARRPSFVIGERAARFPSGMEAIRAAGHEVANHTARHPSANVLVSSAGRGSRAEIDQCGIVTRQFSRARRDEKLLRSSGARPAQPAANRLDGARTRHGEP